MAESGKFPWAIALGCVALGLVANTAWRLASGSGTPVQAHEPHQSRSEKIVADHGLAAPEIGAAPEAADEAPEPSAAEKRLHRYDKNDDGTVSMDEYLLSRRKSFDKLDSNHDGRLSFEEYSAKATLKFKAADANHDGKLSMVELETTAAKRKPRKYNCPPGGREAAAPVQDEDNHN